MSFRRFLETDPYLVTVEECSEFLEHGIIGNYGDGTKKFRVSFVAPRTSRHWKRGAFEDDVVYVIAEDPWHAKKLAQEFIAGRLDPREDQEKPKRVPKVNYLRGTERRHFEMKSRVVGSFRQVAEMLGYAAQNRENSVDFIDQPELAILVDALHSRNKNRYLQGLSEPERRGLRQLLLATRRNPDQWEGEHGSKARSLAQELTKTLWSRRDNKLTGEIGDEDSGFDIWSGPTATPVGTHSSVYRRRLTKRDVDQIMGRVRTYADAIREANRLGISKQDLDNLVEDKYGQADRIYSERKKVYADLYKRLRIPSNHKIFGDDHASLYWQKRGFDWEGYATEVLPTMGLETIRYMTGRHDGTSSYADLADYTDWAVNWLWNLYRQGPPKKEGGSQADRYREALGEYLSSDMDQKQMKKTRQPEYEEIPF